MKMAFAMTAGALAAMISLSCGKKAASGGDAAPKPTNDKPESGEAAGTGSDRETTTGGTGSAPTAGGAGDDGRASGGTTALMGGGSGATDGNANGRGGPGSGASADGTNTGGTNTDGTSTGGTTTGGTNTSGTATGSAGPPGHQISVDAGLRFIGVPGAAETCTATLTRAV